MPNTKNGRKASTTGTVDPVAHAQNVQKAAAVKRDNSADDAPVSIAAFGKALFDKAAKLALQAIGQVAEGDREITKLRNEILLKAEGNSAKLHRLARACVEMTATKAGDKVIANLENAAQLFIDACHFAEENFLADWLAKNPGGDARIQTVAPSWYTLRSQFYNSMAKAAINPAEHDKPSAVRAAYDAWKSNPDNAESKDTRGRRTSANTATDAIATSGVKMTENCKAFLRTLIGTLAAMTAEQQDEAAERGVEFVQELLADIVGEDSEDAQAADKAARSKTGEQREEATQQ